MGHLTPLPPTVQVLHVASGESLRPFPITSWWITWLALACDGKTLVVAAQVSPPNAQQSSGGWKGKS